MTSLERDLRKHIRGEVRFSGGDQALYAADSSNYREVPLGVVLPRDIEDMAKTVTTCAAHGAPVVHRGGGTSLCGQTVSQDAVVIDSSKYCHHIISIDPEKKLAVVEPGVVLDQLRAAANKHGLTFGPDPATHTHNTLGGMLGNNSCGTHSVEAHRTSDNTHSLDIMTYDGLRMTVGAVSEEELDKHCGVADRKGDIYRGLKSIRDRYAEEIRARFPKIPRLVSGYGLDQLLPENGCHVARALVGSESTCVTILRATVRLIADPPCKVLLVIGYDAIGHAADAVPGLLSHDALTMEAVDDQMVSYMRRKNLLTAYLRHLPKGNSWLLLQFGGDTAEEACRKAQKLQEALSRDKHVVDSHLLTAPEARDEMWRVREAGLPATAFVPGMRDTWEGWEDSAVHPDHLGAYVRDFKALFDRYDYHGAIYGHFGGGLIHTRIDSGLHTEEEVLHFRRYLQDAAELVVKYNGTLSGEHGDGRSKAELLEVMYGPRLIEAFQEFKRLWDPQGKMNPGKIVWPKPIVTDLRYGPDYEKRKPTYDTMFKYPESQNSFERAAIRCVGVGECRRMEKGTMCPSYRGTREEKHSTRGRARLLQEMLQRGPVDNGWKSDEVAESLDLCLSCKGCKHDCPVSVDMATYRAEFLYHHYQHKSRPLSSYTMGLVHRWAPLAGHAPWLVNAVTQAPAISAIAKWISGVHQERRLPKLAGKSFRALYSSPHRGEVGRGASTVQDQSSSKNAPTPTLPLRGREQRAILWVDTFNNYFSPPPLLAAAELLQWCGYEVALSPPSLCCGRPYYDFGRLRQAKAFLARCMDALSPMLDERSWLVGIEPSCLSVFRDELMNLFPDDARARRLSERTLTLGAFLHRHGYPEIRVDREIIVHGHCHHKAVLGMEDETAVLKAIADKVNILDSGCCGMAGAFGYERHKYPLSKTIANLALMPAIRQASPEAVIIADGFSCRHQISEFSGRKALTLPEALLQATRAA